MPIRRVTAACVAGALALVLGACSAGGPPSAGGDGDGSASGGQSRSSGLFGGLTGDRGDAGGSNGGGDVDSGTSSGAAGDGSGSTAPNDAGDGDDGSPTATQSTAPAPVTRTVGKSALFAGFEMTVKTMTYTPAAESSSAEVSLDMLFDNQADSRGAADDPLQVMYLSSGDHHYEARGDSDFPAVPGGTRGEGKVIFNVDKDFSMDTAVLTIGASAEVQSVIPLGTAGTLIDNHPEKKEVSGSATSGAVTVTVTGGELRADLPKALTQAQQGTRYLLLSFDETNHSTRPSPYGDYVSGFSDFTLTTPDGNTITAYGDDDYYGGAPTTTVLTGKTAHGLLVVFVVKTPIAGKYTFTFVGQTDDGAGNQAAPGSFDFTLS